LAKSGCLRRWQAKPRSNEENGTALHLVSLTS